VGQLRLWNAPQCVGPLPLQLRSELGLPPRVPCRLIRLQVRPGRYSVKDEPRQRALFVVVMAGRASAMHKPGRADQQASSSAIIRAGRERMRSVELVSPLSRAECVHRLRAEVGKKGGSGAIVGRIGHTSVRLRKRIAYRNWLQPQVRVELVEEGPQTRLRCRLGVHPLSALFIGLVFAAITIAASMVPQGTGVDGGELLMLLGFAFLGYGIFTAVRRGGELVDFLRVNLCVAADKALNGLAPQVANGIGRRDAGWPGPNGGTGGDR